MVLGSVFFDSVDVRQPVLDAVLDIDPADQGAARLAIGGGGVKARLRKNDCVFNHLDDWLP